MHTYLANALKCKSTATFVFHLTFKCLTVKHNSNTFTCVDTPDKCNCDKCKHNCVVVVSISFLKGHRLNSAPVLHNIIEYTLRYNKGNILNSIAVRCAIFRFKLITNYHYPIIIIIPFIMMPILTNVIIISSRSTCIFDEHLPLVSLSYFHIIFTYGK